MDMYYYNLNTKCKSPWYLPKVISYQKYKELNKTCDEIRNIKCPLILHGGWHLSYFGDSKFIKNKIKHFSHQELNKTKYTNVSNIEERIKKGKDLYDRKYSNFETINIRKNTYLPPHYDIYLKKFYNIKRKYTRKNK